MVKRKLKKVYETSYKRNLTINTDIKYLPCDLCGSITTFYRFMNNTPYVACLLDFDKLVR